MAKGLFRATGGKPKPVAVRGDDNIIRIEEQLPREADDFYPTPPEPTRAFLSAELARLKQFSSVWECAAGDGAMVRIMRDAGLTVFGSDMVDRGGADEIKSFYDYSSLQAPAIVTNPPFKECNSGAWVRHAMETLNAEYMALLLPIAWIGAASRAKLLRQNQIARMYVMRWRIDFTGQGAPPMLNAWFVWDRAHVGDTVLKFLDKAASPEPDLFEGYADG